MQTPALPRFASHQHVLEWLAMHVCMRDGRCERTNRVLLCVLRTPDACTATLCKPQACSSMPCNTLYRAAPSPGPNGTSLLLSLPCLVFTPAILDVSCLSTHTCLDACSCHAVHAPSTFLNALQHTIPSGALIRSEWDVPTAEPPLHSANTHRSPPPSLLACSTSSEHAERRPHPVRMGRPCC